MKNFIKKTLPWIAIMTTGSTVFALTVGLYPRHFEFTWDEEIQLHDGRVIVVGVKRKYERLQRNLRPYANVIQRDTEISFNNGGTKIKQLLKGGRPLLLDQQSGSWFLVFSWSSHWSPQLLNGQDWGADQNGNGQRVATLNGSEFTPISICALPSGFQQPNFILGYSDIEFMSKFDGGTITLQDKSAFLKNYPSLYGDANIERPSSRTNPACID